MSLSDPLVKELKGYTTTLLTESTKPISDEEPTLQKFCECFERILHKGLLAQRTVIAVISIPDCWSWLKKFGEEKFGIPYSYSSSVENVSMNSRVETNRGKVRLLIRMCLVKRCLYVPIQHLVNEERCHLFYLSTSILGDPILTSVLVSLLLCLSTITFNLNLENAAFLDVSWHLPLLTSMMFVPTRTLGLYIMFVEGKALILNVLENSVAAESGLIESGDALDSVNGIVISKSSHGSLAKIIKKAAKKPITVLVIKGMKDDKIYPPLLPYWQQAGLDPAIIRAKSLNPPLQEEKQEKAKLTLICSVGTGNRGDIKQINEVINNLPDSIEHHPVLIECYPLGIKLISLRTNEVLKEHTYMEISACGSSVSPSYFGYIAGDTNYTQCKNFVCYIFQSTDQQIVDSLLKTIGQGFKRTLYTV